MSNPVQYRFDIGSRVWYLNSPGPLDPPFPAHFCEAVVEDHLVFDSTTPCYVVSGSSRILLEPLVSDTPENLLNHLKDFDREHVNGAKAYLDAVADGLAPADLEAEQVAKQVETAHAEDCARYTSAYDLRKAL